MKTAMQTSEEIKKSEGKETIRGMKIVIWFPWKQREMQSFGGKMNASA